MALGSEFFHCSKVVHNPKNAAENNKVLNRTQI